MSSQREPPPPPNAQAEKIRAKAKTLKTMAAVITIAGIAAYAAVMALTFSRVIRGVMTPLLIVIIIITTEVLLTINGRQRKALFPYKLQARAERVSSEQRSYTTRDDHGHSETKTETIYTAQFDYGYNGQIYTVTKIGNMKFSKGDKLELRINEADPANAKVEVELVNVIIQALLGLIMISMGSITTFVAMMR